MSDQVLAPKLIMFDLDGTLVDSVPDLAIAIDLMLSDMDLPHAGEEQVRLWVGNGAQKLVERALSYVAADKSAELYDQAFELFLKHYGNNINAQSRLYDGVLEALNKLDQQEIAMAVVTNKPLQFTHPLLKHLGIDHFFEYVVGGDSLPVKKPDPAPLLHIMNAAGVTQQESLMVGDSVSDVRAARNAQCSVVAVPYGYNHGEPIENSKPDRVIDSLEHLIPLVC